jgi:hypothetical protein
MVEGEWRRVVAQEAAHAPAWLKRRGGEIPAWPRADVHRECLEIESAYLAGRATAEQLRRALERLAAVDL